LTCYDILMSAPSYDDYPGYETNPNVNNIVNRCRSLGINVYNMRKPTKPLAFSTLKSRCQKRMTQDKPAIPRRYRHNMQTGGGNIGQYISPLALPAALVMARDFIGEYKMPKRLHTHNTSTSTSTSTS